ncbi:hypothetical protein Q7C36_018114 [Tachysurus vachellii]|uniref:Uncharacterized protein n=1 Tax=Tachysurus vachellii TaxID=175792 RepID=A0AA88SA64_TACVA|nr:hydroperoxide isomerase ALOXE3 [Tachysurus vachellii]XP_060747396.1 hydroperoxide isomerase ALOXE3 [Tachysurus vachellii]KAK2827188.1 hypothetical protein Q7C36_018114 [Tachysurus vachellii]
MEGIYVTIRTSLAPLSGSYNILWVSLIGSQCECPPVRPFTDDQCLLPGSSCTVLVKPDAEIGSVVLVRLRLEARPGFPNHDWHCLDVKLKMSSDDTEVECFPCNRWITTADGDVELRSNKVCLLNSESLLILREHRARDLQNKQKHIRWRTFAEGGLRCIDMSNVEALGPNLIFTRQSPGNSVHYLKGFHDRIEPWRTMKELEMLLILSGKDNTVAKYVQAHWKEDAFFGYQCLNGCNPLIIRRIHCLPPNLAVTSQMIKDFLPEGSSLEQELERGTIFLLDYEVLDQISANVINGKQSYLAAPLCLLHYNQHGELKPIAIQLQKIAGPQNPVFLPSDSASDWLLAKIWVHNADFQVHQLLSHFLRTHLIGEVCCIAMLRKLPEIHPLHQLLMPHLKNSLQINIQARTSLLGPGGVFDKAVGCGLDALPLLLARGSARLHYTSLCVPDDLKDRGLDKLPNCYYAQDALRVWNALHRFVAAWVELYYHDDQEVQRDSELQNWIQEIHLEGFPRFTHTGFPQTFQTKAELTKYITMVIFTSSAMHSAVNFSQLDFSLWMPNCPAAMLRPPPQVKGSVTEEDILTFLPDVNTTCRVLIVLFLLSQPSVDSVPLCQYREWYFSSGAPNKLVKMVQKDLRDIAHDIRKRNSKLELAYPYLQPDNIENSVAI